MTDMTDRPEPAASQLARVRALLAQWEDAAQKPMPTRADTESAQDQGIRIGVWHSVETAARELRAALDGDDGDNQ